MLLESLEAGRRKGAGRNAKLSRGVAIHFTSSLTSRHPFSETVNLRTLLARAEREV